MPIPFTCPYCGLQSNVADQFAGQSGPCSRCGNTITVPGHSRTAAGSVGTPGGEITAVPAGAAVAAPPKSNAAMIIVILVVVALGAVCVIGMLAALLLPAVQAARNSVTTSVCTNNMKQIGLALHNYHDTYGSLPPAYIADETGQPMHSWRVLLLPFLGEQTLYEQYDFDEPWDSPNNISLSFMIPAVYQCPESQGMADETTYMAVNGPGFIFDGEASRTFAEISDGTSNTIMVVETDVVPVHWMSPDDVDWNAAGTDVTSSHSQELHVLLADGSVQLINHLSDQELEAALTIAGGEPAVTLP